MQRSLIFLIYIIFWIKLLSAAPLPQVWTDGQGQIFAIAFEESGQGPVANQHLLDKVGNDDINIVSDDEEEDNMYTVSTAAFVVPSFKDKVLDYVNIMFTVPS